MRLKWVRAVFAVLALAAAGALLASCGDSGTSGSGTEGTGIPSEFQPVTSAPGNAQQGGHLTMLNEGDIDYMDPGAAYYQVSYIVTLAAHRGLVGWPPDATEPVPDLAEDLPEISSDGKTITWTIRSGVKFSPPVNREVTSADVKYAIERSLLPGVPNGYTSTYLADIVGLSEAQKAVEQNDTVAPDISGLTTPDDHTLVMKFTKPAGTPDDPAASPVVQAMSLPVSAPVPEEYAKKFDAESPSTYGEHTVFTGPYMVKNDSSGELTGYVPGKEIELIRNPNWDGKATGDYRPAYLDSITIQEGFSDPTSASQKILDGSAQVSGDFPPSPTVVQDIATGNKYSRDQMVAVPSGGNRYIALNTQEPPFDDVNVRRAVVANSDREALRNTRGGELFGPVASHYIPPQIPGFEEAGGLEAPPGIDFMQNVNGDPKVAAEYMKKAGYKSGKCEGDCTITMVGDDTPPGKNTAEVFQDQLEQLGFDVEFQPVEHSLMYTKFCSVPSKQPNVCPNVGWIKDFNDPQSIMQVPFSGDSINPSNNSNWPQLDDPKINKDIEQAVHVVDPQERAQAWADVDLEVVKTAAAVPWIFDNDILVRSDDVNGVANLFNGEWDLSFTSLAK